MGFSKKFKKRILNEWKQWYMDYNLLAQSIDNEHEFIQKFLHELAKVEEFYMYAEKEILRGKDMMKKLFNIKDEEEIEFRGTVNSEPKVLPTSTLDAGSCFGDTHSSTYSHFELSSSTEEELFSKEVPITKEKIQKTKEKAKKTEKTLKDIKEKIEKTKKIKEEKIKQEILKEKCFESEVDEEREPDNEEETETKPVKLGWKDKIFAQKDKLFANNIFKRNYDKAKSEKAILDYIVSLKHVLDYRNLNNLGFKKILTKFDSLKRRNLTHILFPTVERAHFSKSREIDSIIKLMTNKYTSIYHKNNPKKAKEILKNINKKQKANQLNIFLCGVFLTVSFFIHLNNFYKAKSGIKLDYYFSVMGILLGGLFFGACSVIFKFYSINSPFIFEFTVGSKFQNDKYLLYVSTLILIHQLLTKFIFDKTNSLLCIVLVIIQFFPFHIYYLRSRYYILGTLIKVFSAPLFSVRFKHFFLADVICSFSLCIKLFIFSCELPKSSKLMVLLLYPSLIRVFQCLRRYIDEGFKSQLHNALKYVCSIFSTSYGVLVGMYGKEYKYLEYSLLSVSSTYSLFWDLFFDWNIFRNEYIFPKIYYVLIVTFNLFARYIWLIKIFYRIDDYYSLVIEVVRRFLWLLIRVEIEHLYNCNKLTAMKYVNIKREELFFVKDYKPLSQYLDSEHTISNAEV